MSVDLLTGFQRQSLMLSRNWRVARTLKSKFPDETLVSPKVDNLGWTTQCTSEKGRTPPALRRLMILKLLNGCMILSASCEYYGAV
jgi:hypothetical protein